MKKILTIGWKDLRLAFRDRAALVMMLAAPFLLTLGLGLVTGRFSGETGSGIADIPVILVNQDEGELGSALVDVFQSVDLSELVEPQAGADPDQARGLVDADQAAAAILIPAGFTQSIIAQEETPVQLEVYTNPTRATSASVIQTIVEEFSNHVETGRASGQVIATQLLANGLLDPQEADQAGRAIGFQAASGSPSLQVNSVTGEGSEVEFDVLAYLAPSMALLFLMYTVSYGGRALLSERSQGTLPRLLVSPTSALQVYGGKVLGIFLTGVAQMLVLIVGSTLLFRLDWGDPIGVIVLVLAAVTGAVGWGMLITALARTPSQVAGAGSAIMLLFGILGGSFINLQNMPGWFSTISKITPNAWGINGFSILALGGRMGDILEPVTALLVMGAVLFAVAVFITNRRGFVQA